MLRWCQSAALVLLAGLALLGWPPAAVGQDANLHLPVDTIEEALRYGEFRVAQIRDTRFEGDRTQHAVLRFDSGTIMRVKWAKAPRGGDSRFNNRPRYEMAAYELQKLFLDEPDYVVPPTVARCIPEDEYPATPYLRSTFDGTSSVVVLLQYWLNSVTGADVYDKDRLESDSVYARHLADMNILTYLIRHSDANPGNFVISTDSANPRVFAVDNGVAFGDFSDRGDDWRRMRVDRLPRGTVERLRGISEADLHRALGVLAEFEVRGERLFQVPPTENLDPGDGVRREDDVIQMGLTKREIEGVYRRLRNLLEDVDEGKIEIF